MFCDRRGDDAGQPVAMIVAVSSVQAAGVALVFLVLLFAAVAPSPREYRRGITVNEVSGEAPDDLRPYVGGPPVSPRRPIDRYERP